VLSNRQIVILNAGTQQLLYFSSAGTFLRSVGRAGEGPGEFRAPAWLGRGGGDTLFIWDDRLLRLSVFSGDGEFIESRKVVGHNEDLALSISGRFEDGSFLLVPGPVVWIGSEEGVRRSPFAYQRYDPATGQTTDLADGWSLETVVEDGTAYVLPFGDREVAVPSRTALLVGDTGSPRIRYYDLEGRLVRIVEWASDRTPVTVADRQAFVRRAGQRLPSGGSGVRFSADRPRFSSIVTDSSGRIWVREFASFGDSSPDWLLFDQVGILQCRVAMPVRVAVRQVGPDYMVGVRTDSLDVESVVLLAVATPRGPEKR
jgi:hypothetical protein